MNNYFEEAIEMNPKTGKLEIGDKYENIFESAKGYSSSLKRGLLGTLNNLMSILKFPVETQYGINEEINKVGDESLRNFKRMELLFNLLSPSTSWDAFKQNYGRLVEKHLEVKTSVDRQWSNRVALLSLLGDTILSKEGLIKIFASVNIDPAMLAYSNHPLTGEARANTPFLRIPGGQLQIPYGEEVPNFDPSKPTIAFVDLIESKRTGKTIIAVPVFKEGTLDQSVNPDRFNYRIASSSPVSILSNENELWSNVEYFLVYEDTGGAYQPYYKGCLSHYHGNFYSKDEYTPTSIAELAKFLRLLSRTFQSTTSSADIDELRKSTQYLYYVSPKDFCDQLEAMLYTYPTMAIEICQKLGILEALAQLREIKPILPYSNQAQDGWLYSRTNNIEKIKNNPEADLFSKLQNMDYVPTSTDLQIALLTITGAQRRDTHKKVVLPILQINNQLKIGSAQFDPNNDNDLEDLDKIGWPVWLEEKRDEKTGEITYNSKFFQVGYTRRTFTKLKEEGRLDKVAGIHIKPEATPYDLREVFYGRVTGVSILPPDQKSSIFEKMSKWNIITTEDGRQKTGYYEFCNWILAHLELDTGGREGRELAEYINQAVRTYVTNPVFKILELRDKLATEDYIPVLGIIDTYFLVQTYAGDIERGALNWFGNYYNELIESIEKGNVYEVVSHGFEQALKYIADKLANNPTFEVQGRMLRAMIRLGKILDTAIELRPEALTNALPKAQLAKQIAETLGVRLQEIKKAVDSSILMGLKGKTGQAYISEEYGMQVVAWLKYQGYTPSQIAEKTGLTPKQVEDKLGEWIRYCKENKINELQARKDKSVQLLDKLCQQPTFASIKNMLNPNSLVASGGKMAIGGAIGGAHIIPFITIAAPVLQAIGYTLIAALESSTLSPIFNSSENQGFPNNYHWAGCITRNMMNPDTNIVMAILTAAAVYLTDYMEFGEGAFQGVRCGIDMDWVNVIMAGMQAGMMTLGMAYVSEDTLADLMKPFLAVFGALAGVQYGGLLGAAVGAVAGGVVGLVSCLPQVDQFYKEYIWPTAKLMIGASLMGKVSTVLTSVLANMVAMTAIGAVENIWMNDLLNLPWMQDLSVDFTAILEYLPGLGLSYNHPANYITHYIYKMW
ncbi:MAG: hypothetical protein Q6367_002215 [Candidatus Freyarchaeota archaeon]